MSKEQRRYAGDRRDTGRPPVEAQEHTLASAKHENRNEDTSLGDIARLDGELRNPPDIAGDADSQAELAKRPELARLVESNTRAIAEFGQVERDAADKLRDAKVFGVFDGVSGVDSGMGAGAVASRIASANFAERMAALPPDATVEQTKQTLAEAFKAANTDIADHKKKNPEFAADLQQMACTADVLKAIDNGDGTHEVVYGHVGDSRIYVMDGKTGELKQMTRDDSAVEAMVQMGKLSRQEADLIAKADRQDLDALYKAIPDKDPGFLKKMVDYRQAIVKSVSGQDMEPTIDSFRVKAGDRVLVSTDGIHDNIPDDRIAEIMRAGGGAKELAEEAHRRAGGPGRNKTKGAKGPDDITLQVLEFSGEQKERGSGVTKKLDVRPENFDRAVAEARTKLDVLPSPKDVGQEEHDRQKYEVLRELTAYLTSQLNAESDPAKRERAATIADELAGKGPEKSALSGLQTAVLSAEARRAGREESPLFDMQGSAWLAEFEKAGWKPEQVKDWIEQQRREVDAKAKAAMDADPSLKRLAEAHAELARASSELRKLGKNMEARQQAKDQAGIDQARVRVSSTPMIMFDAAEVRKMRAEAERQLKEQQEAQQQKAQPKKKPWWKVWGK